MKFRASLLFVLLFAAAPAFAQSVPPDLLRAERAAEAQIAASINQQRAFFTPNAPLLAVDPDLNDMARIRSADMAGGAPFAHEDENGRFIAADMMRRRFGPYGTWGENILEEHGYRFDPAAFAARAVASWMNSPGHRRNILDGAYNRTSIGVIVIGNRVYATEVFMGPPPARATRLAASGLTGPQ